LDYTFEELVSNGQKALEAVSILHGKGYQGLRIKPGLSPSGAYWRLKIYNVFAPTMEYFRYSPQTPDKIWYTFEGKDREIQLGLTGSESSPEITANDIADTILRISSFGGEMIVDDTYNLWYEKLMAHISEHGGIPIAYADWDLEPGHWTFLGGHGADFPEPPRGYPVPEPATSWHSNPRAGNYLSANWAMRFVDTKEKEIAQLKSVNAELFQALEIMGSEAIYATLKSDPKSESVNWSRRYINNQEKLVSGSTVLVAQVMRDLTRRDAAKGLSAGELRMLAKAREILVSEIARLDGTSPEDAEAKLAAITSSYTMIVPAKPEVNEGQRNDGN